MSNIRKISDSTGTLILRCFRVMKKNPERTFVASDFIFNWGKIAIARNALKVLIGLGIVEEVETYYRAGKKYYASRGVRGYRLKEREKPT